ncbi:MAG TPA: T9SS type A sorting domain-containing protein [Ignavibacteriales bacterium]|nr:T9SS type A sorting domain-containing protein [Ignavibacteriales bacterium]
MKRCFFFILLFSAALSFSVNAQTGKFVRLDTLSVHQPDAGGWGEVVAGVDLDKDGKPEIYAVNSNAVDDPPSQLTPRIYKYEFNNGKWQEVWSAEIPDIKQNTWPGLTYGDLDKDGKMEIIFAPANWVDTEHPNPDRIFVYEDRGDTSNGMGIEMFGSSAPNAKFKIAAEDNADIRPIKMFVEDYDNDGTPELMFCDRSSKGVGFGILSVDKIPDNGDGSEKWTIEASGKDASLTTFPIMTYYDLAWLNNVLYLWDSNGDVSSVKFDGQKFNFVATQKTVGKDETGSFKTARVTDIDKDGQKEIVFGGWSDGVAYLCKPQNDTLVATALADYSTLGVTRLNGGAYGDLDKDGKVDFVFGSRNTTATKVFDAVVRLQYNGGAVNDPKSYTASVIDSLIHPNTGQLDIVGVGDVNKDSVDEAVYSSGYPRGTLDFPNIPLVILEYQGLSRVARETNTVPNNFFLSQNFPNPFNPSTTIKFGLPAEAFVSLRIFNILGQEVAVLINSEHMTAGSYNVDFNASKLTSGTYIYQLNFNNQMITKKMLLMK